MWHSKLNKCDSGVVGNARPCQGRDRGFEPRLSLLFNKKRTSGKDYDKEYSSFIIFVNDMKKNNIRVD